MGHPSMQVHAYCQSMQLHLYCQSLHRDSQAKTSLVLGQVFPPTTSQPMAMTIVIAIGWEVV